jgi:hypothetical protein
MRGDRKSIFLFLLIVISSIGIVTSSDSNETIAALDATDKAFQSDSSNISLQQQRLDEIRALTAMQSRAATERDARDKIARNIREAADRQSADRLSAALSAKDALNLAQKENGRAAADQQSAEAADRLSAALSAKDALNLAQKENGRAAADQQSAEAADRLSAALSAKDALNLNKKQVPESAPEETDNASSKVAAAVSNSVEELASVEELSAPHQDSAAKLTMEHAERDRVVEDAIDKNLNTNPEVIVNAATFETFHSGPSDITDEDIDDEDVDHEDDAMEEVSIDLL